MWTQIRLLLKKQSAQGPHCLPVCKNRFEKFARIFSRRHKQTTFSDAGFLGVLRVKYSTSQFFITLGLKFECTIYYPLLCLKIAEWVANSVDPDEMSCSVVSHLGLHCLLRPVSPNTVYMYVVFLHIVTSNIPCLGYSLDSPGQDDSNMSSEHIMLSWRNIKKILIIL